MTTSRSCSNISVAVLCEEVVVIKMELNVRKTFSEWEEARKSAEKRISFKQSSLESWEKTNTSMKKSLRSTFRLLKARGYDPSKWETDLKMIESAIPTTTSDSVVRRQVTKPFNWDKFGFLQYPWRSEKGIKVDSALISSKLTGLQIEIENLQMLQERNEIIYKVLQNLKTKAWGMYMQIRQSNSSQNETKRNGEGH